EAFKNLIVPEVALLAAKMPLTTLEEVSSAIPVAAVTPRLAALITKPADSATAPLVALNRTLFAVPAVTLPLIVTLPELQTVTSAGPTTFVTADGNAGA